MSKPTAPIMENWLDNNTELSVLNNERMKKMKEIFSMVNAENDKFQKRLHKRQVYLNVSETVKCIGMCTTLPLFGVGVALPFVVPFLVPIAFANGFMVLLGDVFNKRNNKKIVKYSSNISACKTLLKDLEIITKDVTKDGIITQIEYDTIMSCFEKFNNSLATNL